MTDQRNETEAVSPWAGALGIALVLGLGLTALLGTASTPPPAEAQTPTLQAAEPADPPVVSLYAESGSHTPSDTPAPRPAEPLTSLFDSD
ncbi:hypothetical protein [Algisphaera agarilytica]|uniref:Uncharacterized protein n=1 Tax=Algisphaera agarilytica TaxID=1385975 RepID=A0A7X0H7J4_9BACT|nr:hypothetical protein [Algisphaera agarilytica]MBB6430699.1 hypothetical protein [Algisphaera agarilytica]